MTPIGLQFALHGTIVLLTGMLGGLFFARAVTQARGEVAWRVVHAGACSAGAMLLAIAVPSGWAKLGQPLQVAMAIGLIGGIYLFCIGMVLAAIWSARGIPGSGPPRNRLVARLYAAGTALSLAGCGLLTAGLLRAI